MFIPDVRFIPFLLLHTHCVRALVHLNQVEGGPGFGKEVWFVGCSCSLGVVYECRSPFGGEAVFFRIRESVLRY